MNSRSTARPANLLAELQDALAHGTVARRVETLRRVTDLFMYGVADYTNEQINVFDDVFHCLIEEIEVSAKSLLANRLAPVPKAPPRLIYTLAFDDEIEVAALAHTVVVVAVPGMGDEVQAIKAGVMEIADVFAVNKADREGADRTVRDLHMMLELRRATATRPPPDHDELHRFPEGEPWSPEDARFWEPPIVKTVATRDEGVTDLCQAIERHRAHLVATGMLKAREIARARAGFVALLREQLLAGALARLAGEQGHLDQVAAQLAFQCFAEQPGSGDGFASADKLADRV